MTICHVFYLVLPNFLRSTFFRICLITKIGTNIPISAAPKLSDCTNPTGYQDNARVTLTEGTKVTFNCTLPLSTDNVYLKWLYDNEPQDEDEHSSVTTPPSGIVSTITLTFTPTRSHHNKYLECVTTNESVLIDSVSVLLLVEGR